MATWTTAYVNDLPDSAFACPEQRKYPHHDAAGKLDLPHLRAALSRIGDPDNEQCGKAHLEAHAKAEGLGEGKAMIPVKAQAMDFEEMTAWYEGRTSRRLLVIPFGGPLSSPKAPRGVDLDGEWFSERTNLYGPFKALRDTKERPTDFMHGQDKTLGRSLVGITELDDEPEEDGLWARVWLKAQQARLALFEKLGGVLYGSSEAVYKKADPETGEILEWPYWRQTLAPTPQNIWSVMRPYKAALDEAESAGIELASPLKAWLADLDALGADLPQTFPDGGDAAATATRLTERIPDLLDAWGVRKQ